MKIKRVLKKLRKVIKFPYQPRSKHNNVWKKVEREINKKTPDNRQG